MDHDGRRVSVPATEELPAGWEEMLVQVEYVRLAACLVSLHHTAAAAPEERLDGGGGGGGMVQSNRERGRQEALRIAKMVVHLFGARYS